jgi:biopolymer transport protein ExbD
LYSDVFHPGGGGLFSQQAISIDLPKANTGTPQERELLVVTLNDMGQVFIAGQPVVTKQQFFEKLQTYTKQNPQGLMALYASPSSSYNEVVQVLDLLRQVGGDRVALATLPGGAEQLLERHLRCHQQLLSLASHPTQEQTHIIPITHKTQQANSTQLSHNCRPILSSHCQDYPELTHTLHNRCRDNQGLTPVI